jgi:hypothetical protein
MCYFKSLGYAVPHRRMIHVKIGKDLGGRERGQIDVRGLKKITKNLRVAGVPHTAQSFTARPIRSVPNFTNP